METLLLGISLGWAAGIAPGPLNTLILATALRSGRRAGMMVAMAPLVADLPVIPLTVWLVGSLPDNAVRFLAGGGALVLAWMAYDVLRSSVHPDPEDTQPPRDLWLGVVTNLLNPHPWLFWITVGAPLLVSAWRSGPSEAAAFLIGFYALLIGTKVALAIVVAHGRRLLDGVWYPRLVKLSGVLLLVLAVPLMNTALTGS